MQLLVLGMHRSGTSVLARMLNLMGIYFGPEGISTGANRENPKGFWERRDVRILNDSVLHAVGCDWNRIASFNVDDVPRQVVEKFIERASGLVLEMDAHRPWFIKEPRLCLLLPLWRKVLDVPVCVHIHRHPLEVAASLKTRNDMPIPVGLELWERYVRAASAGSVDLPALTVSHRQLMLHPLDAVESLSAKLKALGIGGLRAPTEREVLAHVRSDLYREREENAAHLYLESSAIRLFKHLEAGHPVDSNGISEEAQSTLVAYESSLPPLTPIAGTLGDSVAEGAKALQLALKEQEVAILREMSTKAERWHEAQLAKLETDSRQTFELAVRLEQNIAEKDALISVLGQDVKDARQDASDANVKLAERDALIDRMEHELGAARELAGGMYAEKRKLETTNSELEAENLKLDADKKNLETKNTELEASKKNLEASNHELHTSKKKLEADNNELEARNAEMKADNARLEANNHELQNNNLKMEKEIAGLKVHVEKTDAHVQKLDVLLGKSRTDIRALEAKIQSKNSEIEQHAAAAASARAEADALAASLEELKASEVTAREEAHLRFSEIARITEMLLASKHELAAERKHRRADAIAHAEKLAAIVCANQARADVLSERLDQFRDAVMAIESSNWWKLAAPLRRIRGGGTPASARSHVPTEPERRLLESSGLFDAQWYRTTYPDVAGSGADPVVHYLQFGAAELRNPSSEFDTGNYLEQHPEIRPGENPLVHYLINERKGA